MISIFLILDKLELHTKKGHYYSQNLSCDRCWMTFDLTWLNSNTTPILDYIPSQQVLGHGLSCGKALYSTIDFLEFNTIDFENTPQQSFVLLRPFST